MAEKNGLIGKILITSITVISILSIGIVSFAYKTILPKMTESIIDNDRLNTAEHQDIRKEMVQRYEKGIDKIEVLDDKLGKIDSHLAVQTAILQRMEK